MGNKVYDVQWSVKIDNRGGNAQDVTDDVTSVTHVDRKGVNSVTVTVDTSQRQYDLAEDRDISVRLEGNNHITTFDGVTDNISDDAARPVATVDARSLEGRLDDISLVGIYTGLTPFDIIGGMINDGPSAPDRIDFDVSKHKSKFTAFAGVTQFGTYNLRIDSSSKNESFNATGNTANYGVVPTLTNIRYPFHYENTTGKKFRLLAEGKDANGDDADTIVNLPTGKGPSAFGYDDPRPVRFVTRDDTNNREPVEITDMTLWEFDNDNSANTANISNGFIKIQNPVESALAGKFRWRVTDEKSVRDGIDRVLTYIDSLRSSNKETQMWVDDLNELTLGTTPPTTPRTRTYTEGDNVRRPVVDRSLDNVSNFVSVINPSASAYAWAYDGSLYATVDNPFEKDLYPDNLNPFDGSPGGTDTDDIGLRAHKINPEVVLSDNEAIRIAKQSLRDRAETTVSGAAPQTDIRPGKVGDTAEVFYGSRGIGGDLFDVVKITRKVTPDAAKTLVEFEDTLPTTEDIVREIAEGAVFNPKAGEIIEKNADGTADVKADDGTVIEDVEVF